MKFAVLGGSERFCTFLHRASGGSIARFESVEDTLRYTAEASPEVLFLLPFYDAGAYSIPEFNEEDASLIAQIIQGGKTKIYIENYPSYDFRDCFIFGLQARGLISNIGKNSICLRGTYRDALDFDLLQKRGGFYFVSDVHTDHGYEVLAEIKNCFGVHKVVESEAKREGVALLRVGSGVFCAMADLTNLTPPEIFSYRNWKHFYCRLIGDLSGLAAESIDRAFTETYECIDIARAHRSDDRREALAHAVREALRWHERSGVMINGGRGGVYEMIRSFDLHVAKNLRGDSSLFTAALFMAAGKHFGEPSLCETAESIADFMLHDRRLQIEEGNNAGLFKWFSGTCDLGAQRVYVSDTSRVANSLYTLWKLTGKDEYRQRLLLCGEALLRWFGGEALLPGCSINFSTEDTQTIQSRSRKACPEFYDAPMLFLRNLYEMTGDMRYRTQILKTAEALAAVYPRYDTVTSHSDNFTYSRLLCVLAVAETIESGPWTPLIDKLLQYFESVRHVSGGFADGRAYYDSASLRTDMEFAVGFEGDNRIADMVYCQNTMLYTLNLLLN